MEGKHPFFKAEEPIFTIEHSFNKRDTIFQSFANFSFLGRGEGGGGVQVFGEKLPRSKVDKDLVLSVVGFESGNTEPFNHASAGPENCIVNSYLHITCGTLY